MHEAADDLIRQAEQTDRAAHANWPGPSAQHGDGPQLVRRVDELSQALRKTREQLERMQQQLQELSARIERQSSTSP